MGWFSKNTAVESNTNSEITLPDLPEFPEEIYPPKLENLETNPKILPALPQKTLNLDVKNAITNPNADQGFLKSRFSQPKEDLSNKKTWELNVTAPPQMQIQEEKPKPIERIERASVQQNNFQSYPTPKKNEPVFIRLDKFQSTVQSFEEIKSKVTEIEDLLKKSKEIKVKEEQELVEWEKEIHMFKTRIEEIDRNIFNKLE